MDLRSRYPARDDLGQAGSWGVRRVIRAEVLTALLLGASRPEPGRVAGRPLDVTVGYGYRPWFAAVWLVLLLTAGTVAFAADRPHPLPGGPVPPYSSFAYTLDLLIPFGAFGLRQAYGAVGAGQWLSYALIASGWILATAVIAGITSAVRRD